MSRWQSPAARRAARGGVAIALVASSVVACTTSSAPPTPRTAPVERTAVTSGVSATGSLTPATEQNLGFTTGGQLTAVNVKVGDRVTAGQVLATIDPFSAQQSLSQAQAQLDAQRAGLNRTTANPSVGNAQDSLGQARDVVSRTRAQADAVQSADQVTIDNARRQLRQDEKARDNAEDQLDRDQSACNTALAALKSLRSGGTRGSARHKDHPDPSNTSATSTATPSTGLPLPTALPTISPGDLEDLGTAIGSLLPPPAACQAAASDAAAVQNAKRAVIADKGNVDAAEERKRVDDESGKLQVANAQNGVVSAQNGLNSASADRPGAVAQQSAQVNAAQAEVATAARNVDDTTLRAPVDGVVTALNGVVGEFVTPSSSTSALAPGSEATLPGTGGAAGGAGASAAAAGATPTRPGGTQFLVLDDVNAYQVVLAFTETDAASIAARQKVRLTFDAVPDLTLDGSVLSVSPAATAISGVISYYVSVVLPTADPRLRPGMTAQAEVLTQEADGVLAVPSGAVRRENGRSVVTVLDPNGTQRTVPVEAGATGDDKTQILSGVREGQRVVLPAAP